MRRVLVVSNGRVGREMAGPGIRALNLAQELRASFDVTLATPNAVDIDVDGLPVVQTDLESAPTMTKLALEHSAVFAQRLPIRTMLALARSPVRVIYDLYDPVLFESMAGQQAGPAEGGMSPELLVRYEHLIQEVVLATGDGFVCASERQRDLWLGWLAALGRLDRRGYEHDATLRSLIDIVPFGIERDPPRRTGPGVRGVLPGVSEDTRVLLWGGGLWDWLDPLTVIRAVSTLADRRDDIRLVFMGGGRPSGDGVEMQMARRARELADTLGLSDRVVVFNEHWVPYDERANWLLDADVGLSAHFADIETRFAFRTRLLDCLWASLPVISTSGDVLGDLIEEAGGGRTVAAEDVSGWVQALTELLAGDALASAREKTTATAQLYAWPRVAERLIGLLGETGPPSHPSALHLASLREHWVRAQLSLQHRGPAGSAANAVHRLGSAVSARMHR